MAQNSKPDFLDAPRDLVSHRSAVSYQPPRDNDSSYPNSPVHGANYHRALE